jgi:4-amino-4-deoxy-L-arabinose transferase-like glycosyltransferase
MSQRKQRRLLALILSGYAALAILYSLSTPIFEASDELWHFPMVAYLAENGLRLPVQDPSIPTPWRQEGSQPPLYYMLAALLAAPLDLSDMEAVRRQNPHADIGVVRPDGNANMIVHHPDREAFPWNGTFLAVQVVRLFSIVLGLGTVYITYRLGLAIFPERPEIGLGAAALNAFLPMFLFISGSVNNDNLSNLLGNLITLQIALLLLSKTEPGWRSYTALGATTGAGLLAKLNIGFLIPLIALALVALSLRQRSLRPLLLGGALSGGLTIVIAGWWYLRNFTLYGDPTGLNVFLDIVGRRAIPANASQLWAERHSFTQAFWGFFGGVNVPMPEMLYLIFNSIGAIGLASAAAFIAVRLASRDWPTRRWLAAGITLLWPLITFLSYLRWTSETPASQGRLIFGALSSILVWMVVGLIWWQPARIRPITLTAVILFFFATALAVPFTVIAPAYARPSFISPADALAARFGSPEVGQIGIQAGSHFMRPTVRPGEYVELEMAVQVDAPLERDWSLFIHLVTPEGVIIGQRDVYPGGGALATSDLRPGSAWDNPVAIYVPEGAYAPQTLSIEVGWYDLPTGERLAQADGTETFTLGTIELLPRETTLDVPNPLSLNFDRQIELLGYSLNTLAPKAGDTLELTLYWRALRPVTEDYVVFAHVIDPRTLTIFAGSDAQPVGWTAPTSTWVPGEIVVDTHSMIVDPDTPPGIYELEIGLYLQRPDGFPRLRIVTPDGGMANDYAYLSRLRVFPRESDP